MNAVFADTFYFLALLNAQDEAHGAAERFAADAATRFVTTAWVLTEVADGLADTAGRNAASCLGTWRGQWPIAFIDPHIRHQPPVVFGPQ